MRLQSYFSKIEQIEQAIDTPFITIVSEATSDGGKAGVVSEVARATAARLVAEARARIASPAEARAHREQMERAVQAAKGDAEPATPGDDPIRPVRKPIRPARG